MADPSGMKIVNDVRIKVRSFLLSQQHNSKLSSLAFAEMYILVSSFRIQFVF